MALTKVSNAMLGGIEALFGVIVQSTDQSDVQAAIAAAGHNGRVFFPPGNYLTSGLVASYDRQIWTMAPGAFFQRDDANDGHWLTMDCAGIEIHGGKVDVNGTDETRCITALDGGDISWFGGEFFNATGWGIISHDAVIVLEDMNIHETGFAALLWQNTITGLQAPVVRRCHIDRRTNYVSSGGILINSGTPPGGGTWANALRLRIEGNTILMPIGDIANSVAIEIYNGDGGTVADNIVRGSRIGVTNANCSGVTNVGNTLRDVEDYAFEIQDCNFCVVTGNNATGTGNGECGTKLHQTATGVMRSNVVVGNAFAGGWPVAVVSLIDSGGTSDPNYPNVVASNSALVN